MSGDTYSDPSNFITIRGPQAHPDRPEIIEPNHPLDGGTRKRTHSNSPLVRRLGTTFRVVVGVIATSSRRRLK
jgi:hypothetical protein